MEPTGVEKSSVMILITFSKALGHTRLKCIDGFLVDTPGKIVRSLEQI